jgi:uncharacterized membrane protein
LWVPVLLLIAYTMKNYGYRKGIRDIMGALVIFLIINSYFILINPSAFYNAVFNPIQKLLIPSGDSPISFLLLSNYPILLNTYTTLFEIAIAIVLLWYIYFNKKVLIAILSMIPFLLLDHTLSAYFTFFTAFLFVIILLPNAENNTGHKNPVPIGLVAVLLLISMILVYGSHLTYANSFDLKAVNQSLYYNSSTNESVYSSNLLYGNVEQNSTYIMMFGYTRYGLSMVGIGNYSIIKNSVLCDSGDIDCLLNVNRLQLGSDPGSYQIIAHLGATNRTGSIAYARLVVYSGKYVYMPDSVSAAK